MNSMRQVAPSSISAPGSSTTRSSGTGRSTKSGRQGPVWATYPSNMLPSASGGHARLDPLDAAQIARQEGDDGVVRREQIGGRLPAAADHQRDIARLDRGQQPGQRGRGLEAPVGGCPLRLAQLEELAPPPVVGPEREPLHDEPVHRLQHEHFGQQELAFGRRSGARPRPRRPGAAARPGRSSSCSPRCAGGCTPDSTVCPSRVSAGAAEWRAAGRRSARDLDAGGARSHCANDRIRGAMDHGGTMQIHTPARRCQREERWRPSLGLEHRALQVAGLGDREHLGVVLALAQDAAQVDPPAAVAGGLGRAWRGTRAGARGTSSWP